MNVGNRNLFSDNASNPYVTDGLVAMWDAEWNAGFGVHTQDAAVWRDLINGISMVAIGSPQFTNNYCQFNGSSYFTTKSDFIKNVVQSRKWTCEVICQLRDKSSMTYPGPFSFCQPRGCAFNYNCDNTYQGTIKTCAFENGWVDFSIEDVLNKLQVSFALNGQNRSIIANGVDYIAQFQNDSSVQTSTCFIGAFSFDTNNVPSNGYFIGNVHCIRLYSRQLSIEERQANFNIDDIRFQIVNKKK